MLRKSLSNYLFLFGLLSNLVISDVFAFGIYIYPSYIIALIIFILWISTTIDAKDSIYINNKIIYICLIILSMFMSYSYSTIFLKSETDFSYFVRELLLYLPMIPFFLFFNRSNINEKQIDNVVIFLFAILILVTVLQLLGVEKAVTIYSTEAHVKRALKGNRLVLTGSDPNVGALIASFFLMYFISSFFNRKSYLSVLLSLIALALIFLTQSRTTIIGISIVILCYALVVYKANIVYKLTIVFILIASGIYLQSFFDLTYLYHGLELLLKGENNSFNTRIVNTQYAFDNFLSSPVFGWGSSLEHYGKVRFMDSEFALILQRYGLFGVLIVSMIIIQIFITGVKYRKYRFGTFLILMMSSLIFNMLTNVVFFGPQSTSIIVFLLFLVYYLDSNYLSYPNCKNDT